MAGVEQLLEQPDLSIDIKDNGKVNISIVSLNDNSTDLVNDIVDFLATLPPFQNENGNAGIALRLLKGVPHWGKEEKGELGSLLNGSKKIFCLFCVAMCKDVDDLTDASSNYAMQIRCLSNPLMVTRCLIFGSTETLTTPLKGKSGFTLINNTNSDFKHQVLSVVKHCITVVYSNITTLLGDKNSQKKAGSLGKTNSSDAVQDEDELKRKQCRSCKAQGDYYLLLTDYAKAMELYNEGLAVLEKLSKKEYVWLGAIYESILSIHMLRKEHTSLPANTSIQFEFSLSENVRKTDSNSILTAANRTNQQTINDKETIIESPTLGVGMAFDTDDGGSTFPDIVEGKVEKQFQHALHHYSRAGHIGKRPLFELYLKYAGYLVEQKDHHGACKQLNEAQIVLSSEENLFTPYRLSLYLTLGKLYHSMGLKRKTLFMMFNAGREAIKSSTNDNNLKYKGYQIFTQSLKDFGIVSSNEKDEHSVPVEIKGWPLLQAIVLMEYIQLCWKMEYYDILIRWAWLCLQTFYSHLSLAEVLLLTETISKSVNKIKEASTDQNIIIHTPFPVSSIPHIYQLKPQALPSTLSVKQSRTLFPSVASTTDDKSPFIYHAVNKKSKSEVLWVQGDPAEVVLVLSNPLPVELKVEKMTVVFEGADASTFPSQINLPPLCIEPQQFVLLCIPSEPGSLSLTGHTALLFGMLNTSTVNSESTIKVLPSLPQLRAKVLPQISQSLPHSSSSFSSITRSQRNEIAKSKGVFPSVHIELMDGEICDCTLQMQSIGDVAVNNVKISVKKEKSDCYTIEWNETDLQALVPMQTKNQGHNLPVRITVNLSSSERLGPSKTDQSHVRHSILRTRPMAVPREPAPIDSAIHKSKTLTLRSTESERRDLSKSPSPASSPRRTMGKFSGSFRRSLKKSDGEPKRPHPPPLSVINGNKSDLLESLDLHNISMKPSSTSDETDLVKPPTTPDDTMSKYKIVNSKESGVSRMTLKAKFTARFTHRKPGNVESVGVVSNMSPVDESPATPTREKSPPISIPNSRLMDSLNLDIPLAGDLTTSKRKSKSRESNVSDSTTDTASDIIDFDSMSGDRVSITSDPGSMLPSQPKIISSPSFNKFSSNVPNRDKRMTSSGEDYKRSMKFYTYQRKKGVTPMFSLPGGGDMPPTKQALSGLLMNLHKFKPLDSHIPSERTVIASLLIQYTGGEGAKEGYYREVSLDLQITVKPALYLAQFSVEPVKGSTDQFSFLFTMMNISATKLEVTVNVKQETPSTHHWVIEAHKPIEVSIPMKRFTLANQEANLDEKNILKLYCDHLVNLIDIKWLSPEQNKTGIITLTGLELPQSVVASIRPLPVIFNYRTEAISYITGVQIAINIDITNNTDSVLPPCAITLKPFTISSNGTKIDCVKAKTVLYSQSLTQWLPEFPVHFTYKLKMNMIFLRQNNYTIEVILHKKNEEDSPKETPPRKHSRTFIKNLVDGSTIRPYSKTEHSKLEFVSGCKVNTIKDSTLDGINDFIVQSKAYAGPQLLIKIDKS